jgi:hypothetical protein
MALPQSAKAAAAARSGIWGLPQAKYRPEPVGYHQLQQHQHPYTPAVEAAAGLLDAAC